MGMLGLEPRRLWQELTPWHDASGARRHSPVPYNLVLASFLLSSLHTPIVSGRLCFLPQGYSPSSLDVATIIPTLYPLERRFYLLIHTLTADNDANNPRLVRFLRPVRRQSPGAFCWSVSTRSGVVPIASVAQTAVGRAQALSVNHSIHDGFPFTDPLFKFDETLRFYYG